LGEVLGELLVDIADDEWDDLGQIVAKDDLYKGELYFDGVFTAMCGIVDAHEPGIAQ